MISMIGRAAVELSRTSMEAANMAGNSVDEAVEQFLAGWTGNASPVKAPREAAAGRPRPAPGETRPLPGTQRQSSSDRHSNASLEAWPSGEGAREAAGTRTACCASLSCSHMERSHAACQQ